MSRVGLCPVVDNYADLLRVGAQCAQHSAMLLAGRFRPQG